MQYNEGEVPLASQVPGEEAGDNALTGPQERLRRSEVARLQLEEQLEQQQERLSQAHESHRRDVEALRGEFEGLQRELASASASVALLTGDLARTEAARARAVQERDLHEAQSRQARRELATTSRNLEQLRTMRSQLQQKLRLEEQNLERMQREIEALHQAHDSERRAAQAETETVRTQVAGLHTQLAALQQDAMRYRGAAISAERRAESVRNTISFRLGKALIDAKSWSGFSALPSALWGLRQEVRSRRAGTAAGSPSKGAWLHALEPTLQEQGLQAAEALARSQAATPDELATAFTRLARLVLRSDTAAACRLAREAHRIEPRPFRAKWLAFLLHDSGQIVEPHQLLDALPPSTQLHASEKHRRRYIEGQHALHLRLPTVPPRAERPAFEPVPARLLYVAASSLPYNVSGYTLRTQGLLAGLAAHGREPLCVTRPGYPADRTDAVATDDAGDREVDGVRYLTLPGPHRRRTPPDQYIQECARVLADEARGFRPALIQAASNHEAALPALLAARAVGVPFIYEVRGLWEYTSASKVAGWEGTERFALEAALEALVAREADLVFTLTAALADELVLRGVDRARIRLAPNAVDPEALRPLPRDAALAASLGLADGAFVAGYVGSVIGYEGLDDLVSALSLLRREVPGACLLVVGDGDALPALRTQAAAAGLADSVVFAGKVAPSEVARYYALMDALCLPRKPFKVCQLVSPIKPVEAMLLRVPLVVSDVAALKEMVREGETALVHPAGDALALAHCLLRLQRDRVLGQRLVGAAALDVLANRTWQHVTARMDDALEAVRLGTTPAQAQVQAARDAHPALVPLATRGEKLSDEEKLLLATRLEAALAQGGRIGLRRFLALQTHGRSARFRAFCELKAAQACLQAGDTEGAFMLADTALALDASPGSLRAAARIRYNGADLAGAVLLAERLEALAPGSDERLLAELRGRRQLAEWAALPPAPRAIPMQRGRVLNILAFSLPYASVGYATRSHGLALGIRQAGWDVRPCTRPGFPFDARPELKGQPLPETDGIDGIVYRRLFESERKGRSEVEYLHEAIALYEALIREEQPELVHAASNYVTALPALIAARRLGVPFVYEVRGFWEVTRSSRDGRFEHTPKYRIMRLFERLVATHADRVITITQAMRETLAADGVLPERIAVAYNGADPQRFVPSPRDEALADRLGLPAGVPVIGYAGSFVDYEGLDDLIAACGLLAERGIDFRLLLVGDGAVSEALKAQVAATPWAGRCIFTGRVPHDEVDAYYSLVDIAPFPRKPWEVCELVSPLKPFEAMAAEKAVIVSGTRALREVVNHENNGLVFDKGNVQALADGLERLVADADLRAELGRAARAWVQAHRSWNEAGRACAAAYEMVRAEATAPPQEV